MTQEEKQLLLQDLCTRSPYGLICSIYRIDDWNVGWRDEKLSGYFYDGTSYEFYFGKTPISIYNEISKIKPYLRPVSSMTEEEKQMMDNLWKDNNKLVFADPDEVRRYRFYDISVVDFLNSRHFDYRGLIEKGLALEAPEDMYK